MDISFKYRFEAAHRFTHGSSKCTTPHGHTWWVDLTLSHNINLVKEDINFSWDFKDLKVKWKNFVDATLDHSYFSNSKDPLLKSLYEIHGEARVLETPGDPTTEILALLFFKKAQILLKEFEGVEVSKLTLNETPTNSVSLSKSDLSNEVFDFLELKNKWWTHEDPLFRK